MSDEERGRARPETEAPGGAAERPAPAERPAADRPGPPESLEADDAPESGPRRVPLPDALPVLPLRGAVAFPGAVLPLAVGRPRSLRLLDDAMRANRLVALVTQRDQETEDASPDDLHGVGTAARIVQLLRTDEGTVRILVQGLQRVRLRTFIATDPYPIAHIDAAPERTSDEVEAEGLRRAVVDLLRRLIPLIGLPAELAAAVEQVQSPVEIAYVAAATIPIETPVRQAILEIDQVEAKLRKLVDALQHELSVRELGQSITDRTQARLNKAQREAILREQLRSIQAELGEGGAGSELDALRRRIEEADLADEARREAERELDRLAAIPEASPEHGLVRSWLEWVADLPWGRLTGGEIEVARARRVLDEDHYDLDEVKDRILEHLAVRKLRRDRAAAVARGGGVETGTGGALDGQSAPSEPGDATEGGPAGTGDHSSVLPTTPADEAAREPILCFVGPPGVGKTSLGHSIARALGRKFVRMSLGGVRDEAEVRGHRRTYIGAFPGRIIQGLRRVEARDPVFMLDEIDKVGADWRGDPTSALLEVLDPAQNDAFTDTYIGVPFDLSQVLFIATANTLDTIPPPLLDRMEVLRLAGYTEDEKVRIAEQYLVPQQRRAHGLTPEEIEIREDALRAIVGGYTREAGVRDLDRRIAQVCRKVARGVAERAEGASSGDGASAEAPTEAPLVVTAESLPDLLGRRRHFDETAERTERPGVSIGLAWTPTGGEILFVEAALTPDGGDSPLILTGMLGDVMRESAQAALTYVASQGERYGIDPDAFRGKRVHIHVPAGALPKDGPSAGVAIATAIASLALGHPVRENVAATGEITLRGRVLPVGGIKEKVLAAHRAGITTIVLPRRNEADLDDVPEELRSQLTFRMADDVADVFEETLGLAAPERSGDGRERLPAAVGPHPSGG
jgi:ATP-dependent Lon protease